MKLFKKISIFASFTLVLSLIFSVCAFAIDKDLNADQSLNFNERLEYALQGTVTGILMVFAVLTLLTLILYLSKVVFYDMPRKSREKKITSNKEEVKFTPTTPAAPAAPVVEEPTVEAADDTELAAVITAAIAAMLEGEEYADQFKSGFRVVSFKRASSSGAWNKK